MSWVSPHTFVVGEVATASTMNVNVRDNTNFLLSPSGAISGSIQPGLYKLWDSTEAATSFPAASITSGTLPGTYKHLRVEWVAASDQATTDTALLIRFNGDSGANYDTAQGQPTGGTWLSTQTAGATSAHCGDMKAANGSASHAGSGTIVIPSYAATTFYKSGHHHGVDCFDDTAANFTITVGGFLWKNTAAITSLTWLPGAGNFITGTQFTVYGEM